MSAGIRSGAMEPFPKSYEPNQPSARGNERIAA
jgi:hypothetical protein